MRNHKFKVGAQLPLLLGSGVHKSFASQTRSMRGGMPRTITIVALLLGQLAFASLVSPAPVAGQSTSSNVCAKYFERLTPSKEVQYSLLSLTSQNVVSMLPRLAKRSSNEIVTIDPALLGNQEIITALRQTRGRLCLNQSGDRARQVLAQKITEPEVITVLPTDTVGIARVFGIPEAQSAPALRYSSKLKGEFGAIANAKIISASSAGGQSQADVLRSRLRHESQSLLILAAHNARGEIPLPDGSTLGINEATLIAKRPLLILSCDTVELSNLSQPAALTTHRLEFDELPQVIKFTLKEMSSFFEPTYGDIMMLVDEYWIRDGGAIKKSVDEAMVRNRATKRSRASLIVEAKGKAAVVQIVSYGCAAGDDNCSAKTEE